MDYLQNIVTAFELHSVEGIIESFENGINPNDTHKGKPLINELINMYSRGPLFKKCVQAFVDYGLNFPDKILLAVLLDDSNALDTLLSDNITALQKSY